MNKKIFYFLIIFLVLKSSFLKAEIIILIDKGNNLLQVREKDKLIASFEVGQGIKSYLPKEKQNDFLTPEGLYKILEISPSERFKYFIEIDYPNLNDLAWAYYKGIIEKDQFLKWVKILEKDKILKDTPLGNKIGIHGGGAFKIEKKQGKFYKNYYWTKGCIALNDQDLYEFFKYIRENQKVFIINSEKKLYDMIKKLVYPVKIKSFEIFEGELYLKLNEYTYLNFYIVEKYQGLRKLIIKKWVRGALKEELISDDKGELGEKEKHFKNLLIENLENLLFPYKEIET